MSLEFENSWRTLPGSEEEKQFLQDRFRELSVQERIKGEAITRLDPPITAGELINQMEQLRVIDLYYGLNTAERLGSFIATAREHTPSEVMPFVDVEGVAEEYMREHDGVIIDGGYAEIWQPFEEVYTGDNLKELSGGAWAIKLKVASQQYPDGLWLDFPNVDMKTGQDDPNVYLDLLKADSWEDCELRMSRCRLPYIENLSSQFDSLETLVQASTNLGYLYDQSFGTPEWKKFEAALQLEGCTSLNLAMDIFNNLSCYDFMAMGENLEQWGRKHAAEQYLLVKNGICARNFDYAAYARSEIEKKGMQACDTGYIRRNDTPFQPEFYPTPQNPQEPQESQEPQGPALSM